MDDYVMTLKCHHKKLALTKTQETEILWLQLWIRRASFKLFQVCSRCSSQIVVLSTWPVEWYGEGPCACLKSKQETSKSLKKKQKGYTFVTCEHMKVLESLYIELTWLMRENTSHPAVPGFVQHQSSIAAMTKNRAELKAVSRDEPCVLRKGWKSSWFRWVSGREFGWFWCPLQRA